MTQLQTAKLIWLIREHDMKNQTCKSIAAYLNEDNARECAKRLVGSGPLISLQSLEIMDVE
jgi:hypothetical protein